MRLGTENRRQTLSAACAGDGSACAVATEDDAEWVPDGVDEDSEPCLRLT